MEAGLSEKEKVRIYAPKKQDKLKWGKLGGTDAIRMMAHQYEMQELQRIARLVGRPTARGSLIQTARIALRMIASGEVYFYRTKSR